MLISLITEKLKEGNEFNEEQEDLHYRRLQSFIGKCISYNLKFFGELRKAGSWRGGTLQRRAHNWLSSARRSALKTYIQVASYRPTRLYFGNMYVYAYVGALNNSEWEDAMHWKQSGRGRRGGSEGNRVKKSCNYNVKNIKEKQ